MANHPHTVNSAEIINTYNLLAAKLQGTFKRSCGRTTNKWQHNVTKDLKRSRKKHSKRYGFE